MFSLNSFAADTEVTLKDDRANPIRLFAIFHDDLPESKRETIYGDYIRPFTQEFENVTGRKIHVIFDENKPPYSNFNYKGEQQEVISEWRNLVSKYRRKRHDDKEFLFSDNDRFLLITNDVINGSLLFGGLGGVADSPGSAAIASLETRQIIGHELGHTFNATHEDGEVLYQGWWCETFMFSSLPLRSSCFVYSEANRKRIKDYVDSLY